MEVFPIMWDRKELKQRGRAAFTANYWKCVVAALLLALFVSGGAGAGSRATRNVTNNINLNGSQPSVSEQRLDDLEGIIDSLDDIDELSPEQADELDDILAALNNIDELSPDQADELAGMFNELQADPEVRAAAVGAVIVVLIVLVVIIVFGSALRIFVFGPLEVGCQSFFLRNAQAPAELGELGRGFRSYWPTVGAMFLRDLFLLLWSLLLIVPGIVKSYSYRLTPYILADNPGMKGTDAITLSRRMMDGQKWNAFVLDLSFIGWGLLSALTGGLLGIFYVNPYRDCTNAELYHTLKAMHMN